MNQNEKNLTRRYLIWFYKDVKEALDKVDRYYTQEIVDGFVAKELKKVKGNDSYKKLVGEFEGYIQKKVAKANKSKFVGGKELKTNSEYQYLKIRLKGVEKAIVNFFGKKELSKVIDLYEAEMTRRILESGEH